MGTSEISGIGNMFTPGQQTTGSVGGTKGQSLVQTFQSVMSQMQTPSDGSAAGQKDSVGMTTDTEYGRQPNGGVKIREESGVSSDRPEELSGKLEEFAEDVKEVLKEELGVSEEDIAKAMETLGLTFADLLNPNQLAALVMKLTGESNMGALFCREEFMTILHAVGELGANLAQELGISQEELAQLLSQMQNTGEVPQEETGAESVSQDAQNAVDVAETVTEENAVDVSEPNRMQADGQEQTSDGQELVTAGEESAEADASGGQKSQTDLNGQGMGNTAAQTRNDGAGAVAQNLTEVSFAGVQEGVNPQTPQVDVADIIKQIVEFSRVTLTRTTTTMEMQLNPEHLGKIFLQLTAKDGMVSAHITAQNEAVKEAIESQMVLFRENMNEAGVKVDAVEVTVGSHEFEKNLEQNAKQEERQAEEQEKAAKGTRHINLNDLDELSGLLTEEETLVAQMMAEQGNSVDFTA